MAFGTGLRGVDHPPGGFHTRPGEAVLTLLARLLLLLRRLLAPGGRFMPRHPGPPARRRTAGPPGFRPAGAVRQCAPCCPVTTPCCSAMIASRACPVLDTGVSRIARSSPVSIVPLCHNSAPAASAFQPGGGLRQIRLTKSEQLRRRRFGCRRGGCVVASIGLSLFWGRFAVTKPLSQKHRSTFLPLQDADPTPLLRWIRD